ncbi:MAG: CatA-like O-acetyltransferase [Thermoguttaceae bacterium]
MRIIDLHTWNRREHFQFFSQYSNPFTGVTVNVDGTNLYRASKTKPFPFSLGYHFSAMLAVNAVENLRIRIENDVPVLYDSIHLSTTVPRADGTFGFSHHPFTPDFQEFLRQGENEFQRVRNSRELFSGYGGNDTIYCTVIKDLVFTSFEHAYNADAKSSVPLLAFGKAFTDGDIRKMPVSLHFNHAVCDGKDAAEFYKNFQHYLNEPF